MQIAVDITDDKLATNLLVQSEERYRSLFETSHAKGDVPSSIVSVDRVAKVLAGLSLNAKRKASFPLGSRIDDMFFGHPSGRHSQARRYRVAENSGSIFGSSETEKPGFRVPHGSADISQKSMRDFCSAESEKCDFRFPHKSMNNVADH